MTTTTHPEALISTPAEDAQCPACWAEYKYALDRLEQDPGLYPAPAFPTCSRFEAEAGTAEFPHCDVCGSTDLVDLRSPFQVLAEAVANIEAVAPVVEASSVLSFLSDEARAEIVASTRLHRMDVAERVRAIAAQADPGHCSDCTTWAVRVAVGGVRF